MSLLAELKRRNVFKVGAAYLVTAWLIAQVTDVFLNNFGAPDWFVRSILFVLIAGFPVALILAWAYELTPGGLRRQSEIDGEEVANTSGRRKLDRVLVLLLALALIVLGVERIFFASPDVEQILDKSIAVLPFVDLSEGQDQRWFADGLTEEIINALTKTPDIRISSRTSSFRYVDKGLDVAEIADKLGVAHVLEGSVRRSGDKIRVTAQLIRARDSFHVWAENYDRSADEVIQIQEDLAIQIARALQTTMDPVALQEMLRIGTQSVEAYELYLRGQVNLANAYNGRDAELFVLAYEQFERARSIDPGFAAAHSQASLYWYVQLSPIRLFSDISDKSLSEKKIEFDARTRAAIENAATDVDKLLYRATAALVNMRVLESIRLFQRYLENRPQHLVLNYSMADAAEIIGDKNALREVAEVWREQGLRQDQAAGEFLSVGYDLVDPQDTIDYALDAVARYPDALSVRYAAHRALLWAGDTTAAARIAPRWSGQDARPNWSYLVDMRQACAEGRREDAESIYAEMTFSGGGNTEGITQMLALLMLGRDDDAYAAIQQYIDEEVPYAIAVFLAYPHFDASRIPLLQETLTRDGVALREPAVLPYGCPAE